MNGDDAERSPITITTEKRVFVAVKDTVSGAHCNIVVDEAVGAVVVRRDPRRVEKVLLLKIYGGGEVKHNVLQLVVDIGAPINREHVDGGVHVGHVSHLEPHEGQGGLANVQQTVNKSAVLEDESPNV